VVAALLARPAHREHPHLFAVLLAEQRHRPGRDRVIRAHQPGDDLFVVAYLSIHHGLDVGDLFRAERLRVREIEPQPVFGDERALLRDVLAEPVPQGRVEQVGGRMVGANTVAALGVDGQTHGVAYRDRTRQHLAVMRVETAQRLGRIGDLDPQTVVGADRAGIAHLPATLAVERRLIGEYDDVGTGFDAFHFLAALQ